MEYKERRTKKSRRIDDRRNNFKGPQRRMIPDRRTQKDRRESE